MFTKKLAAFGISSVLLAAGGVAHAQDSIRVAYAGSMGVVMDKALGPTFAKKEKLEYQGHGDGAYGLANLLASKKITADVFVSITAGPVEVLKKAGLVDSASPVASTSMVIAYNPKGPFGKQFAAGAHATHGPDAWYNLLQKPGIKFARTDPATDPQGQNIVFTIMLADKYYKQPGMSEKILGGVQNPKQVYTEGGLLTRLESGQLDASSSYESAAISAKVPFVRLPDEINLSNPTLASKWYDTVSFSLTDKSGTSKEVKVQPLVFYAAVLKNAQNPKAAAQFIKFLHSPEGQKLFAENGYGKPKGKGL